MKKEVLSIKTRTILYSFSVLAGIGIFAYIRFKEIGKLDGIFYVSAAITIIMAFVLFIFLIKRERKTRKDI